MAGVVEELIWRCAGVVGVEPWSFTLRQLVDMHDARQMADWDRACVLWHAAVEPHRDRKRHPKPLKPTDIHPYYQRAEAENKISIGEAAKREIAWRNFIQDGIDKKRRSRPGVSDVVGQ